jgi:hypothetical protein
MRTCLIVLPLFLGGGSLATAQFGPANVVSAKIEEIKVDSAKSAIRVNIKNTGDHPITAFSVGFYKIGTDGQRTSCGGRGVDMIDWSDPMPHLNIYAHMRRNWIQPNGSLWFDGYPRCQGEKVPFEMISAELEYVLFDDGTGEGDPKQMNFVFLTRQQARDERLKWLARFVALRNSAALKSSSQQLYQDLVDGAHESEIIPERASQQGMAKPVREELQSLALQITEWASRNDDLKKNEVLDWRITDLEQRTSRLLRGAGKIEASPY